MVKITDNYKDLAEYLGVNYMTQCELAEETGISQSNISRNLHVPLNQLNRRLRKSLGMESAGIYHQRAVIQNRRHSDSIRAFGPNMSMLDGICKSLKVPNDGYVIKRIIKKLSEKRGRDISSIDINITINYATEHPSRQEETYDSQRA